MHPALEWSRATHTNARKITLPSQTIFERLTRISIVDSFNAQLPPSHSFDDLQIFFSRSRTTAVTMPSNLPSVMNATTQDIEMLLAAQCHIGSKNLQVHMAPYLWKTRADGVNILNIGKTYSKMQLAARSKKFSSSYTSWEES